MSVVIQEIIDAVYIENSSATGNPLPSCPDEYIYSPPFAEIGRRVCSVLFGVDFSKREVDLADDIDGTKIADDAVDTEHIADNAIELAHQSTAVGDRQFTSAAVKTGIEGAFNVSYYIDIVICLRETEMMYISRVRSNFYRTGIRPVMRLRTGYCRRFRAVRLR